MMYSVIYYYDIFYDILLLLPDSKPSKHPRRVSVEYLEICVLLYYKTWLTFCFLKRWRNKLLEARGVIAIIVRNEFEGPNSIHSRDGLRFISRLCYLEKHQIWATCRTL